MLFGSTSFLPRLLGQSMSKRRLESAVNRSLPIKRSCFQGSQDPSHLQGVSEEPTTHSIYSFPVLIQARLLRRYKRFLADVELLSDGSQVTVYCPNTGPMVGLLNTPFQAKVALSASENAQRKYKYTLEMIQIPHGWPHLKEREGCNNSACRSDEENDSKMVWVGVHSAMANTFVARALEMRALTRFKDYSEIRREVKHAEKSRIDFVLRGDNKKEMYIEVKSVTLLDTSDGLAVFPDTVSTRAHKHLEELIELKRKKSDNIEAAIVFVVQRGDATKFAPSLRYDPKFAALCKQAQDHGIELIAYGCTLKPSIKEALEGEYQVLLQGELPLLFQKADECVDSAP